MPARLLCALVVGASGLMSGCADSPTGPTRPSACQLTVSPTEIILHWHGGSGEFAVSALSTCVWHATTGAAWMTLVPPTEGTGDGAIRFTTGAHTLEASRIAAIEVRGAVEPGGRQARITQEGCRYAITQTVQDFSMAGGRGTVFVFGDPVSPSCALGCPWTAVASVSWMRITSSMPRAGDDLVVYEVEPNSTGQSRVGEIRIDRMVLTVRQAG
jgi:hypothetical protein